jgi:hypothetical protein
MNRSLVKGRAPLLFYTIRIYNLSEDSTSATTPLSSPFKGSPIGEFSLLEWGLKVAILFILCQYQYKTYVKKVKQGIN